MLIRLYSLPRFLLVQVLFFLPGIVQAQFQGKVYEQRADPLVWNGSTSEPMAWCGGINSVQVIQADLNNDGKQDLVLFDQNINKLKTFINTGNPGDIHYTYDPKYEQNFPAVNDYVILKDYNCDGIPDLFHKGFPGVSVYKGYYQNNQLMFTYYKDLYFPGTFGQVNVYVQPSDIPAIIDVDGDGDLDVVTYGVNGNLLEYTKNLRVENGLPCDSMVMDLVDNCYGKFYQGFSRAVNLGFTSCKGLGTGSEHKTRHTGNCIALLDIDGDGDLDIMGGNISFNDVQLLMNGGSSSNCIITQQDTLYNHLGHELYMPTWAAPFYLDIDNDGDKDLLFTSHNENASSANYHAVAYYKNNGSTAMPNLVYQHDSLFMNDMIDVGSYSYPALFDYDKDGKPDLFIGTEGYLDNASGTLHSKLAYYKNTSTAGAISFQLVTNDFLGLSSHNYDGIFPAFGDLTGDGIADLVLGNIHGTLALYKNYAASNTATPNFMFNTDSIAGISVDKYSAPFVYDFNQDGKTDLLVGNQLGKLAYYEDTSSTSQKKLALQTISLGGFKAGDVNDVYGYCVPFIGKMDDMNKEYLLIGNIDGTVARYDNFINNFGTFQRIDSNYSFIQMPPRSVPAVADLDGDGTYDMLIGNRMGGLCYYKQVKNVLSNTPADFIWQTPDIELYPNPAHQQVYIWNKSGVSLTDMSVQIITTCMQEVGRYEHIREGESLYLPSLSPGMYVVVIQTATATCRKKLLVVND